MILITEFSKQAAKHPERIAARTEHKEMTYKELSERSDRMASYLKSQAYTNGHVALFFEQGIDMIVSVFSVLKAGMTYIPLSDSFPDLRMKYILEDAHAEILVTNTRNMDKAYAVKSLLNHTIEIINIDTVDAVGEISSNDAKAFPNEIAYILYTSGSTGNPKGVMQKQENIYYYARQYAIRMNIQPGTKMTLFSSFSHDAAVIDIFSGILHGATLYPKDMREEASFHHVLAWLKQEKINIWHSVPTLYRHFCLALRGRESFHDLTHVVLGGEHVVLQDIVRFETFFDGPVLVNLYGQSESSFNSSQCIAGSSTDTPIRLGDPIEGTQVFVVNEHNEEVMPLGVGEIVIASAYIAPGYWGKPEDTTKVFDTDPELGRLYWTGDKGRLEIDGSITWMGRKDNQVKIRGYRVELAEIEHCMMGIQGIRDVAVVARDKGDEESELVAFYTITKTAVDKEIQQYMKGRLPDYMIPSYFIAMDQIPLTASGKIDRKSLQHLNIEVKNKNKYIEPRDEVEVKLALLWESLLGVGQVGIDDQFFELGGHSLKAIQLVGAIQREFGVEMGVRYIFDHPSIRELGGKVKECSEKTVEVLSPLEKKESYPVSSAQKRLYVIQNLNRNSIVYNMPMLLELRGEIDLDKVRQAIRALVMKHEVLRTSFHMERESIVQKVHDNVEPEMEYIKTTGKEHTDQVIAGWIRPFDLAKAPLMRSGVIETGDRLLLLLDMHHIISDGTTMGILAEEFVRAYAYGALEVEPIQYKEYSQWEAEQKEKGSWEKQKEYWKKEYEEEIPVLELPTDGARGKTEDNQGEKFRFEIEEETVRGLKKVASTVGGTLYMGLMAGFSILLSKYSRQEDIVVGTPIAGRRLAQVENMAGMFVNTLAIRTKPVGDKRIEDYLQEVKEKLLGAYENQDYPYEELVEEVQVNRDMVRNPLFDVMLVLQNNELKELTIPGVQITPALIDSGRVKFDISLVILEHNERLICEVEFKSQLFRRATIQSMMKYFVRILRQISEEGYKPIKEIELVDDEDRQHLMSFNQTTAPYENQATLVQLFEQQVERTPDAVAVMFREASLTYRELSEKANQFARKLRQYGVCRDQIVGIMMERSLEMIIGIYTVLKAGGAYLPIDPSFPRERIEYMLTDSGTKILLTRGRKDDAIPKQIQQLDLEEELSDDGDKSNLEPINHPTDLAYVIYTSGSTGRPKGVMIEHHSVINQLSWMQKKYPIGPGDTILQKTAFTFDVSVRELFWWSFQGAAVAMLEPGGEKEPAKIVEAIAAYQITTLHFVPSM
ncbi:non-ribosomal peptide synthetase, partial [Paenibacillus polymyxa]|uniref:non-ribosomal peptide synthetase n=1 Tax=Paenibacillus polymyxa TaxID=1406 RepID=UPI000CB67872